MSLKDKFDELPEGGPLAGRGKAVKNLRVFPHHEMREQTHGIAQPGQVVEGAHRHQKLVAHAVAVHQQLGRIFLGQLAS
jgi:hypothetical protein